ncbi:cobalamin synthesis protein protein, putative [Babesia ovis]|uniref:Cobalamin synthesis protein protein, putative n=1 Tax=Babesia ovis TaxID=5869 RepID=A0A9W5WTI9_BABOV|nr:cobalamin synthesis protein protein, putative [Babesia ovis]
MEISTDNTIRRIPVTLVTGFLGSGKTTFIQKLLKEEHGLRIAVLQNEFSPEMGIEKPILSAGGASVFELPNGCLCCSLKDGIVDAVESILQYRCDFDWLVVEAAGNVDPLELASNFWMDPESPLVLDGVLSVTCPSVIKVVMEDIGEHQSHKGHTDTKYHTDSGDGIYPIASRHHGIDHKPPSASVDQRYKLLGKEVIDGHDMVELMRKQLSVADVIIFNKIDQIGYHLDSTNVEATETDATSLDDKLSESISFFVDKFISLLQQMNPTAKLLKTNYCNVDFADVMNLKMFDSSRIMSFRSETHKEHTHDVTHTQSTSNVYIKTTGVYSLEYVHNFVSQLLWESGITFYRCKGIFRATKDCTMIGEADGSVAVFQLQGVGMLFEIKETDVPTIEDNRFLFIGHNIRNDSVTDGLKLSV